MSPDSASAPGMSSGRAAWALRLRYAAHRPLRALRLLEARTARVLVVRAVYRHLDVAPPPAVAVLRLTNQCNLRCGACGQWGERGAFAHGGAPASPELSTEAWKAVIARLAPVCPHVHFFGGEPLLRSDCLELVAFASARGMAASVNTNGIGLRGKGDAVVAAGLDYAIVSLNGPGDADRRTRPGVPDGFSATLAGVEELLRARRGRQVSIPVIELLMTVTEENQHLIDETARIAEALGVDYFAVNLGTFTTEALAAASTTQHAEALGRRPGFYRAFVRDTSRFRPEVISSGLKQASRRWASRFKQYPPRRVDLEEYYRHPEHALHRRPCLGPWLTMQVMPDGEVAFCEDFADHTAGNVLQEDPLTIWNGARSRMWRRRIRTHGIFPAESRCCGYYLQS